MFAINAFSLIEVIIYIALFSMLMSGILASIHPLMRHSEQNAVHILRESEIAFIDEKLRNTLRTLMIDNSVVVSEPLEGNTSSLVRITHNGSELLTVREDDSLSFCTPPRTCSMLLWSENGNVPLPLNNERISIDALTVTHVPPNTHEKRRIEISYTADGIPVGPLTYVMEF